MNKKLENQIRYFAIKNDIKLEVQPNGQYDLSANFYKFAEELVEDTSDQTFQRRMHLRYKELKVHSLLTNFMTAIVCSIVIGITFSITTLHLSKDIMRPVQPVQEQVVAQPADPEKYCPAWLFETKDLLAARKRMCGK